MATNGWLEVQILRTNVGAMTIIKKQSDKDHSGAYKAPDWQWLWVRQPPVTAAGNGINHTSWRGSKAEHDKAKNMGPWQFLLLTKDYS